MYKCYSAYSGIIWAGNDGITTGVVFNTVNIGLVSLEGLDALATSKVPNECLSITALLMKESSSVMSKIDNSLQVSYLI